MPPAPLLEALDLLHEGFMVTSAEVDLPGPQILYVNSAFTRMTGYTLEDLAGQTPRILQGPKTDRRVIDRLRACLETGQTFEGETTNYRKDGSPFFMRWYIEPVVDETGQITHFFAVQRDVTDERKAQQQRRALEQAVSQLTDSVVLFGDDGKVHFANAAYLSWSKRGIQQVIGAKVWSLPGAPQRRMELHFARHMLRLGKAWHREYAVQGAGDGAEKRFVFVTVSPIRDASGEINEYVAVCRDVTQRRRLESIAEASNFHGNLGYAFSGIRHELGNPINSIKTSLGLLLSTFDSMPRKKLRDYLERMREEIGRVEYLLRSLRSYSLYDRPRLTSLQLAPFLDRFKTLAKADFEQRGIDLSIHCGATADQVWADPQALHQVLFNLIGNAANALEGRDKARVEIRAGRRGEHISLVVRDNGPGIPAHHLPHLFKPFYTTRANGTGLGLPISRNLLSMMRGTIDISSSETGTEVLLLLDRRDPKQLAH